MEITNVGKTRGAQDTGAERVPSDRGAQDTGAERVLSDREPEDFDTRLKDSPGEIRISVRGLVEFVLRSGDIDNRRHASSDNAMQEGSRIHRMIQKRMGSEYQAEVPLKITIPAEGYRLVVEGRADGIIRHEKEAVIDEIKGTYRELAKMREPVPVHVAQAKCYACMYGLQEKLDRLQVRLTYCNMVSEDVRYFYEDYTFEELSAWFEELITAYRRWSDYMWQWKGIRQASIRGLPFPFPYREGQKELVTNVYKTIYHKKKLFLEAPTGVGKTISTIYPALQAMGKGMGDKIFYLTAKTITRTVADDTLNILRGKGLHIKSVILTAKEKICFMEEVDCNPELCPYAKGHYDRVNDAIYELLTSEEGFTREKIEAYARKHQVCPFEMCLDMSLFADVVIGDYNYLFDPHVYLKRFFSEGTNGDYLFLIDEAHNLLERGREMYSAALLKEQFLELRKGIKEEILSCVSEPKKRRKSGISGQMTLEMTQNMTYVTENRAIDIDQLSTGAENDLDGDMKAEINTGLHVEADIGLNGEMGIGLNREISNGLNAEIDLGADADLAETGSRKAHRGGRSVLVKQGYGDRLVYLLEKCNQELLALKRAGGQCSLVEGIDDFVQSLDKLHGVMEDYLSEQEEEQLFVREQLLDFYFDIGHFLEMYELADENYVKYTQLCDDGSFLIKLFCVNPGENLRNCMLRGRSSILFSATFLPIQYYKKLLGGTAEDYEVYAQSVFDPGKRALFIAEDVTSKYTRRSEEEYDNIARYIEEIVKNRHGNYMVFCPSYAFLWIIYEKYVERFADRGRECIIQSEYMSEVEREEFLAHFQGRGGFCGEEKGLTEQVIRADAISRSVINMDIEDEDGCLIGFCVLGGIFSEGIDLKNDSLIGAVIVGTGLPQVCFEREILKDYFNEAGEGGFDYSYRYPGMNKVLQAAGRVIRTVDDVGIVALLDERFLQFAYRRLFPREWEHYETVTLETISRRVERFWDEWL